MTQVARFLLSSDEAAQRLAAFLKQHRRDQAAAGHPLLVTVAPFHPTRDAVQNARMWAILRQISQQARVEGVGYIDKVWNIHFKKLLLPDTCSKGLTKWRTAPGGEQELVMSTSDLDHEEMDLYLLQLRAEAADLGVHLSGGRQQQAPG